MTVKVFRDAYMAARFLEGHGSECHWCKQWTLRRRPMPCPPAQAAMHARDRADALLEIPNTREARNKAWLSMRRSPSKR